MSLLPGIGFGKPFPSEAVHTTRPEHRCHDDCHCINQDQVSVYSGSVIIRYEGYVDKMADRYCDGQNNHQVPGLYSQRGF